MSSTDLRMTVMPPTRVTFAQVDTVSAHIEDHRLAALLSPATPGFERFRVLGTKVKALGEHRFMNTLGLVSATAEEGTSAVALGLAAALAQEPARRVLLVEIALRAPALERMLGLSAEPGLAEWLAAADGSPVPLHRLEPWGFLLLAGGAPAPDAAELLAGESLVRLLAAARQSFDFTLLDCPPLETVADAATFQDMVDGFLVVVRPTSSAIVSSGSSSTTERRSCPAGSTVASVSERDSR
jgi:Mrp family chromosome partitioning ATPase